MTHNEELIKALRSSQFAVNELQAALKTTGAVEALVLIPIIADAASLAQRISELICARAESTR